jgi:hypothetical protein
MYCPNNYIIRGEIDCDVEIVCVIINDFDRAIVLTDNPQEYLDTISDGISEYTLSTEECSSYLRRVCKETH